MSFADKIRQVSNESKAARDKREAERTEKHNKRIEEVKHERFTFLTEKYFDKIIRAINNSAKRGLNEKFMNFEKNDFKANCHGLGYPSDLQKLWLKEMSNPTSPYLPENNDGEKISLNGFTYKVKNNKAFTTRFYWGPKSEKRKNDETKVEKNKDDLTNNEQPTA